METQSIKNVSKKLLQVINAISGKVNKSGYNSFQKYKYVTEGDLIDAVREELVKNGLMITTSVVSSLTSQEEGSDQYMTHVILEHNIVDVESGEVHSVRSAGSGADKLDKGVYKAITGANKYFLLKTFLLSGDDDPENDAAGKPPQGKPAAAQAAPKSAGQGFLAGKTTTAPAQAAKPAAAQPPKTSAPKPAFGAKKPEPQPVAPPEEEDDTPEAPAEEDPGF